MTTNDSVTPAGCVIVKVPPPLPAIPDAYVGVPSAGKIVGAAPSVAVAENGMLLPFVETVVLSV
jgi:hypothetical protein